MGVQRQQERWTCLYDTPSCMPVPVEVSLVPFGLPKPTLQLQGVREAWQRVATDAEACGTAGHPPCPGGVTRGGEACALLLPGPARGLPRRGGTVRRCQRGRDPLALLQGLTDDLGCRLPCGHAAGDPGGQALEVGVGAAATVGLEVTVERSPDVSPGRRHASPRWWARAALSVMEYATHGATGIQPDRASIRRRVGRGGDVLGSLGR
jgi:hypothetical protein